jgi:glycosyltransferase involved in cell wall biosynthesis
MAECARSSSLFKGKNIEVIPNGLDIHAYRPFDKYTARSILSLPHGKKIILFGGSAPLIDTNKGFRLLVQALKDLVMRMKCEDVEILLFGSSLPVDLPFPLTCRSFGTVRDSTTLSLLYSAADLTVVPSLMESLSYTVMESMSCGTPCVAFETGGIPDLIKNGVNGYLAKPFEPADLAAGMKLMLHDGELRQAFSGKARLHIEDNFSFEIVATKHKRLYEEILSTSDFSENR